MPENNRFMAAFGERCGKQVPQVSFKLDSISSSNIVQIYSGPSNNLGFWHLGCQSWSQDHLFRVRRSKAESHEGNTFSVLEG